MPTPRAPRIALRGGTGDRYFAAGENKRVSRLYHSLGGRISPLDHVGPEDLRIDELMDRVEKENFSEIIFALASDVEGEATTNYLVDLLKTSPSRSPASRVVYRLAVAWNPPMN